MSKVKHTFILIAPYVAVLILFAPVIYFTFHLAAMFILWESLPISWEILRVLSVIGVVFTIWFWVSTEFIRDEYRMDVEEDKNE